MTMVELITVADVAAEFGVTTERIRQLINDGTIKPHYVARFPRKTHYYFRRMPKNTRKNARK